jgi:hypothetical protein
VSDEKRVDFGEFTVSGGYLRPIPLAVTRPEHVVRVYGSLEDLIEATKAVEPDSEAPEALPEGTEFLQVGEGIAGSLKKARKRGWREGYAAGLADARLLGDPEAEPQTNPYED